MRTLRLAGPFLGFVTAFATYGCALDVSGLAPTTTNAGGAGSGSASVGPGGGTATTGDTVTSTTTGTVCIPTAEKCDDGDDNDCDGLIDCADKVDCTDPVDGHACIAKAPDGWTVVSFTPDAAAACPSGFGSPVIMASPPESPSTACTCTCGNPLSNPCTKGMLNIQIGFSGCGGPSYSPMVTGACNTLSANAVDDNYATARANALAVTQVACDATGTPAAASPSGGVICLPSSAPGGGCAAGDVCLPKGASSSMCIQSTGDVACPADSPYTKRRVLAAPADVLDERKCDGCSCKSTATSCSGAKFTGYDDAACTKHPVTVDIDNTCNFTPGGTNFKNNKYFIYNAAANTLSCAVSGNTPTATGGFKVNKPTTICCQ